MGTCYLALLAASGLTGCAGSDSSLALLFDPADTSISRDDQSAIFDIFESWVPLSADGRRFEDPLCGDMAPSTEVVDLNVDGEVEVFLYWGNTCSSGMTGRRLALFVKDAQGEFHNHFGFPAASWTALENRVDGWPDLEFGGPGFCFGVWSWNGSQYEFKCNRPQMERGCESYNNVCYSAQ